MTVFGERVFVTKIEIFDSFGLLGARLHERRGGKHVPARREGGARRRQDSGRVRGSRERERARMVAGMNRLRPDIAGSILAEEVTSMATREQWVQAVEEREYASGNRVLPADAEKMVLVKSVGQYSPDALVVLDGGEPTEAYFDWLIMRYDAIALDEKIRAGA